MRTLLLARLAAIATALGAAIPTGFQLYQSWVHGVPFSEVGYRLAQSEIWKRNWDCHISYSELTMADGARVRAGGCPRTGDVSIVVTVVGGKTGYEWVSYDRLKDVVETETLLGQLLLPVAFADQLSEHPPEEILFAAQAQSSPGSRVICETPPTRDTLIRIVQEGNTCYRETISIVRGILERRETVPCNTPCGP